MENEIIYPEGFVFPTPRRMTVLAFLNRFTLAEHAVIELAAAHRETDTAEMQMRAAYIRAYLTRTTSAKHIEPDRDDTRGGLEAFEHWGYLAPGRAIQILDAEIQPHEKPEA